jgi:hypothetical protein
MLEVFLKSPGIIFVKATGAIVRTPIKFKIKKSDRQLYESLIRVSSITDFEIKEISDSEDVKVKTKKISKGTLKKPKLDIGLNFKIKG